MSPYAAICGIMRILPTFIEALCKQNTSGSCRAENSHFKRKENNQVKYHRIEKLSNNLREPKGFRIMKILNRYKRNLPSCFFHVRSILQLDFSASSRNLENDDGTSI